MDKILVAVDGSKTAEKAVLKAKEIGKVFNSAIVILHVVEDLANPDAFHMSYLAGSDKITQNKLEEKSGILLDEYLEIFNDYDGKVEGLTGKGKPGDTITKVAELEDCNLIIMGSRGLGAFSGAMLGSVSNKVVNRSKMSVLIVK